MNAEENTPENEITLELFIESDSELRVAARRRNVTLTDLVYELLSKFEAGEIK